MAKPSKKRIYIGSWLLFVLCVAFAFIILLPIWVMLMNATRATPAIRSGISFLPSKYLIANLQGLLSKDFPLARGYFNSAFIAFTSTILSVYFSLLTAYGFYMYRFRFKRFLYGTVLGIILVPGQLGMIGWYRLMVDINLTDSYIPLIIPGIAAASTVFFLRQYLDATFSREIIEASRIDGANEFYSFNKIVVPMTMPALSTMAIFSIIGSWNNYIGPLMILSDERLFTMPMLVEQLKTSIYNQDLGAMYAGIMLTIAPLIIIYLLFSRQIIRGVALGGVKE